MPIVANSVCHSRAEQYSRWAPNLCCGVFGMTKGLINTYEIDKVSTLLISFYRLILACLHANGLIKKMNLTQRRWSIKSFFGCSHANDNETLVGLM